MYVTNLLVADGREILLRGNVQPRFAARARRQHGCAADARARTAGATAAGKRLLRQGLRADARGPGARVGRQAAAHRRGARRQAAYDEVVDDPVLGCVSPGMPRVMLRSGPYAVRFVERGADLVLQNEWFEIDRHDSHGRQGAARRRSRTRRSAIPPARWDGDALVITTTHIDWPYFELYGLVGVPQSRAMRIVERFTPRDGGATLRYDFSATDPAAFTEPVTYENYATFRWQPSLEFLPYDCIETERKARSAR